MTFSLYCIIQIYQKKHQTVPYAYCTFNLPVMTLRTAEHSAFPASFSACTEYFPESSGNASGSRRVLSPFSPGMTLQMSSDTMVWSSWNQVTVGSGLPLTLVTNLTSSPSGISWFLMVLTNSGASSLSACFIRIKEYQLNNLLLYSIQN